MNYKPVNFNIDYHKSFYSYRDTEKLEDLLFKYKKVTNVFIQKSIKPHFQFICLEEAQDVIDHKEVKYFYDLLCYNKFYYKKSVKQKKMKKKKCNYMTFLNKAFNIKRYKLKKKLFDSKSTMIDYKIHEHRTVKLHELKYDLFKKTYDQKRRLMLSIKINVSNTSNYCDSIFKLKEMMYVEEIYEENGVIYVLEDKIIVTMDKNRSSNRFCIVIAKIKNELDFEYIQSLYLKYIRT
ncbi:hypothetical protein COBT_000284 [Conglomerata obtusa]